LVHVVQKCQRFHLFQHRPKSGFHQTREQSACWYVKALMLHTSGPAGRDENRRKPYSFPLPYFITGNKNMMNDQ
jgi:hypothetical protein